MLLISHVRAEMSLPTSGVDVELDFSEPLIPFVGVFFLLRCDLVEAVLTDFTNLLEH